MIVPVILHPAEKPLKDIGLKHNFAYGDNKFC